MQVRDDAKLVRREFLAGAAAAATATVVQPAQVGGTAANSAIELGLIGCGGRGPWLGEFFRKHGGYRVRAVADYFADRADAAGEKLGVDKARRFSGRNGYRRLLESGVQAVAVINVPRFHPEMCQAAVEAGCHVFAAKPVAIDVPGAMRVQAAAQRAAEKKLCFLVDYQLPTDPVNIEVVKRIHEGGVGRLGHIDSIAISPPWAEPPVHSLEQRLRSAWCSLIALSGDVIVENSIHIINAVLWITKRRPTSAIGRARVCRPNPRDDYREIYLVTYEFDDGLLWTHRCQSLNNQLDWALNLTAYGEVATALVSYRGRSYLKGGPKHFGGGNVESLYDQGAIRNVAAFHQNIVSGRPDNSTALGAVDDALTAALGREAAARRCPLTMEEFIKENKALELDLSGLKG